MAPMNRFAAKAFIEEVHGLLRATANAEGPIPEEEEARLLELEDVALGFFKDKAQLAEMRIIRNDAAGPSDNEKEVGFNSLAVVTSVEEIPQEKILEFNGELKKLQYVRYEAQGETYEVEDGETEAGHPKFRSTSDSCSSGAEGFIETDDGLKPFGAASALAARLLEAKAAGLV